MSITINIHAETVTELHRDLRQLLAGAGLGLPDAAAVPTSYLNPTQQVADKPKPTRTAAKAQTTEQVEQKPADPSIDDMVASANAKAEEQRAEAARLAAERETGAAIDYETDIKPLVLKLAEAKGRAGVLAVLDQFGVDNASKVPADKHAALRDALVAGLTA